jgi:DNA-binding NtrC family response regulator
MRYLNKTTDVLLGESKAVTVLRDQIFKASAASTSVLIYGPPGAGKEVTARAIHAASGRRGTFTPINVSQASEFISRDVSWCDAAGANDAFGGYPVIPGDCQGLDGGTVFLKEICQLQPSSQVMLLRALKGRLFHPTIGDGYNSDSYASPASFRLISATKISPEHLLKGGQFREKLLRQLGRTTITVPSLVQRYKDIPVLALHFLSLLPEAERPLGCTAAAMRRLQEYHWPGNVRELQRVITAAATLAPVAMLDEMAITFALDTVDRERHIHPVLADSLPNDERSDSRVSPVSGQPRGTAIPNHLAKRTISYGFR